MIRQIDARRPQLFIGDRLASSFRLIELRAHLERLKVPGIEDHSLGSQGLLDAYERHLRDVVADTHPSVRPGNWHSTDRESNLLWQAARVVAQRAEATDGA